MSKLHYALSIDSIMYTMACMILGIANTIESMSIYISNLGKQHWDAAKWILSYLRGSLYMHFCFTRPSLKLQSYVDADLSSVIDG